MAYDHTQHEHQFTSTAGASSMSCTASGQISNRYYAGNIPFIVRGFSAMALTSGGVYTSVKATLKHLDCASGSTATDIDTLNFLSSDVPGKLIYSGGLNVKVNPGSCVYVNIDTTPTATGTGDRIMAKMYIEPCWEQPLNDTDDMRVTT